MFYLSRDLGSDVKSLLPHLDSGELALESGLGSGPAVVRLGGAESDVAELGQGPLHAVAGSLVGDQAVSSKDE